MKIKKGHKELFFFLLLGAACVYLAYTRNFPDRSFQARYEIYSDKAHYYGYLPATFIYNWDAKKFPENCDKERGGFILNRENGKVIFKTTCGVAIMWLPFFVPAHLWALHYYPKPDGFSLFYEKLASIPGAVFLVLGLFFLRRFLKRYFSTVISYFTVILIFLGTNLYFYSIDDGLYSHVHSFFLFSLYLFLLAKFLDSEKKSILLFTGITFVVSLAILVRPTNILILSAMAFLDVRSGKEILQRFRLFLKPKYILIFIAAGFITFLPQFFYWKYMTGNFMYYSYPNESFSLWKHPMVVPAWFSPLNGLFIYSPLVLLFVAGCIYMIVKKISNGYYILILFLFISYLFSSWHAWYFGGSFGARTYVEYYAFLAIPFGYFLSAFKELKNLFLKSLVILSITIACYYNLTMTYNQRWITFSIWSWDDYLQLLDIAGIYDDPRLTYTYKNDFENGALAVAYPSSYMVRSRAYSGYLVPEIQENAIFSRHYQSILKKNIESVDFSIWTYKFVNLPTGALYQLSLVNAAGEVIFSKSVEVDKFLTEPGKWMQVTGHVVIPEWIDTNCILNVKVTNPQRQSFYLDDQKIIFH